MDVRFRPICPLSNSVRDFGYCVIIVENTRNARRDNSVVYWRRTVKFKHTLNILYKSVLLCRWRLVNCDAGRTITVNGGLWRCGTARMCLHSAGGRRRGSSVGSRRTHRPESSSCCVTTTLQTSLPLSKDLVSSSFYSVTTKTLSNISCNSHYNWNRIFDLRTAGYRLTTVVA